VSAACCNQPKLSISELAHAQHREIRDHVKEDFWEIVVNYSEESGRSCTFHWNRGRLFDHATAVALYEPCVDDPLATVIAVSTPQPGQDVGLQDVGCKTAVALESLSGATDPIV